MEMQQNGKTLEILTDSSVSVSYATASQCKLVNTMVDIINLSYYLKNSIVTRNLKSKLVTSRDDYQAAKREFLDSIDNQYRVRVSNLFKF